MSRGLGDVYKRQFGYLAFPGRVGIWPEITVITLKKSKKQST